MPFAGEPVRFDLAGHVSTLTRQMVQIRVRLTAQAFGVGDALVAANVTADGTTLEVDAAALMGANAAVRSSLEAGPEAAVTMLRRLAAARSSLDRRAAVFAAQLTRREHPGRHRLVRYVEASARYQALGALKFCMPETLRPRLARWLPEPSLVDALLTSDGPTLWSTVRRRELALAGARLRRSGAQPPTQCDPPSAAYQRRLEAHQRAYGYLRSEDVDFQASESIDAIDARMADLGASSLPDERRRLSSALAADRAAKRRAREAFAARIVSEGGEDIGTLVSHVLLARALSAHEDDNRRAKMRFLRDLRDLADFTGLDVERADLSDLAARSEKRVGAR